MCKDRLLGQNGAALWPRPIPATARKNPEVYRGVDDDTACTPWKSSSLTWHGSIRSLWTMVDGVDFPHLHGTEPTKLLIAFTRYKFIIYLELHGQWGWATE